MPSLPLFFWGLLACGKTALGQELLKVLLYQVVVYHLFLKNVRASFWGAFHFYYFRVGTPFPFL